MLHTCCTYICYIVYFFNFPSQNHNLSLKLLSIYVIMQTICHHIFSRRTAHNIQRELAVDLNIYSVQSKQHASVHSTWWSIYAS